MTATEPGTCDSLTSQDASSAATDAVSVGSAIGGEGGDADAGIGADTGNDSDLEVHAGDDALADAVPRKTTAELRFQTQKHCCSH